MNKSLILEVHGRVQGVGFRYFVQRKATELSIKGFVKNKYNETVYIEAEGVETNLKEFISALYHGNSYSRTDNIFTQEQPWQNFGEFSIK